MNKEQQRDGSDTATSGATEANHSNSLSRFLSRVQSDGAQPAPIEQEEDVFARFDRTARGDGTAQASSEQRTPNLPVDTVLNMISLEAAASAPAIVSSLARFVGVHEEGQDGEEKETGSFFTLAELEKLSEFLGKEGQLVRRAVSSRFNAAFGRYEEFMERKGRGDDIFLEKMDKGQASTMMSLYVLDLHETAGLREEQVAAAMQATAFAFRVKVPAPRNADVFSSKPVKDAILAARRTPEEAEETRRHRKLKTKLAWNWVLMKAAVEVFGGDQPVPAGGFTSAAEMDRRIFLTTIALLFDSSLRPCATCSAEGKEEDHTFKRKDILILVETPGRTSKGTKTPKPTETLVSSGPQFWKLTHSVSGELIRVKIIGIKVAPTSSKTNRRGGVSTPEAFWLLAGRSQWEDRLIGWMSDVFYHSPGTENDDAFTRAFFEGPTKQEGIQKYLTQDATSRPARKGTKKLRKGEVTMAAQAAAAVLGLPQVYWSARSMRAGAVQFRLLSGLRNDQEILGDARERGSAWARTSKTAAKTYSKGTDVGGVFSLTHTTEDEELISMEALKLTLMEITNGSTEGLVADSDSDDEGEEAEGATAEQQARENSEKETKKRKAAEEKQQKASAKRAVKEDAKDAKANEVASVKGGSKGTGGAEPDGTTFREKRKTTTPKRD